MQNYQWAAALIASLRTCDVEAFVVSPGYRNAPLIACLAELETVTTVVSVIDERAAGYVALGMAQANAGAVALVCTSGTAVANYFPAIIEAQRQRVRLVVVSADRTFEGCCSGENQSINQGSIFGKFVAAQLTLPSPSPALNDRFIAREVALLLRHDKGPVHINIPFQEPLQPPEGSTWKSRLTDPQPYVVTASSSGFNDCAVDALASRVNAAKQGMLLVGSVLPVNDWQSIEDLVEALNWPTYFDACCPLGYGDHLQMPDVDTAEGQALIQEIAPDVVLHLGNPLVSKFFDNHFKKCPPRHHIVVSEAAHAQDVGHSVTERVFGAPTEIAYRLKKKVKRSQTVMPLQTFSDQKNCGSHVVAAILNYVSDGKNLFLGNSSAIRAFDHYTGPIPSGLPRQVYANRGVSGIEGHVATAAGLSLGLKSEVVAVVGDVSLLHDLSSIALLNDAGVQVTLVIINSGGGAIFERLPIAEHRAITTPFMTTPHQYRFDGVAQMFNVAYQCFDAVIPFSECLRDDEHVDKKTSRCLELIDPHCRQLNGTIEQERGT